MIRVRIVADSVNVATEDRITSFLLTYPRFIHSELMTHRVFSRNAASSRAIPVEKMIAAIHDNPATPNQWGTAQKGMQAGPPLIGMDAHTAENIWVSGMFDATDCARALLDLGVHKQITNRVLEPWMHMTTLVTATDWGNFFRLRAHSAAEPNFQELAYDMLEAYLGSDPDPLTPGKWHLPYDAREVDDEKTKLQVCVARCARTSYVNFDGTSSTEQDVELHDRLLESGHMSPFEHPAQAADFSGRFDNFSGWRSYRYTVEPASRHASPTDAELRDILSRRPRRGG